MRFLRWITRSLILLLIALFSALAAMRFAIHGREVRVPNLKGLSVLQAQEMANQAGLIVAVDDKFYSSYVPDGKIISQAPAANSKVRRGWRVRVAESLGEQRVTIPDLLGQTERAATLNLRRRGLEVATVAGVPYILRLSAGLRRPKRPVRGSDIAGVVEAAGRQVTDLAPGDEVLGSLWGSAIGSRAGAFAQYTVAPASRRTRAGTSRQRQGCHCRIGEATVPAARQPNEHTEGDVPP